MSRQKKLQTLKELEALVAEKKQRETFNRLYYFKPYPWQEKLLASSKENKQTLLMAANRVGKSFIGAANVAFHATGKYPDWWEGHRWDEPVTIWAAGVSAESTRDILQLELVGPPDDITLRGSGMIPRDEIVETVRRPQVPNALQSVLVRHYNSAGEYDGNSRIVFKAYEQGESKFMGASVHEVWLDEQPPDGLFTQCVTRTANTGGHVTMTFTPEDGVTPVVHQFTKNRKPGMALIGATWDDAPHLTPEVKEQILALYGEHEREMRSKGVPIFGSGPVFAVLEEDIICEPFEIPEFWPGIAGLDFGWDHPTAVVWLRWDRDSDTVYVVDTYRKRTETVAYHATAILSRARYPVAWPHDGMKHEVGAGVSMADQYRVHGVNMLPTYFTNPPVPGDSSKGNYKVEPGINALHERMQTGRFKVFATCTDWFEEFRMYHREAGKIVAMDDDLMSATRYAAQSLRFAEVSTEGRGYARPYGGTLKYSDMGLIA
jgi:phage terminase large subunit-like protein